MQKKEVKITLNHRRCWCEKVFLSAYKFYQ